MHRLDTVPPRRALYIALSISFVAMLLIWFQLRALEAEMTRQEGSGIVAYELAFTPEKAAEILSTWDQQARMAAQRSLIIDYAFMPAYAITFAAITLLTARAQSGRQRRLGFMLTFGSIAAALFDALENTMLLSILLSASVPRVAPVVAGLAASVKFALLAAAILYWVFSLIQWGVRRLKPTGG